MHRDLTDYRGEGRQCPKIHLASEMNRKGSIDRLERDAEGVSRGEI